MVKDPNNDSINSSKKPADVKSTIIRKSNTWNGTIAKEADFITRSDAGSFGRSKVRFDGQTEKSGSNEREVKNRIGSCREAYENVGIIGNIIDLMTDFGIEGIEIYHPSKPIEKFFKQWARKVKLRELSEQILKSIYRDGNVPILSYTGKISDEEINKFKRSFSAKNTNSLFEDRTIQGSRIIPYKYKVLDVLNLSRTGNDIIGEHKWAYQYNTNECKDLAKNLDNNTNIKKLKDSLGKQQWENLIKDGLVELDPHRFNMLFYKKDGYRCWANPMLWRIIDDVKFKKILRDMDVSVAEGVTNALTIVKLGDIKAGLPPSKNKYNKMVSMLKNPSKSKTIVWDDLIQVETEYPPVKDFFSAEKYKQVDDDIRSGLGIAEILVNGGGGNYSNSFLSVKTLLERLETGRQILLDFIRQEIEIVTKNMGFRSAPHIRMTNMSLTNEEVEKKFILELFDRNALSYETLVARFGENLDIEFSRMVEEDKKRDLIKDESPFALLRVGKFGPQYPNGPPGIAELIEVDQNLPTAQEEKGKDGGSPTGPRNRKKDNEPKSPVGQGVACIIFSDQEIEEAFEATYASAKTLVCEEKNYLDARSLKSEDIDEVLSIVIDNIAMAMVSVKYPPSEGQMLETDAPAKLDSCIKDVMRSETDKFIEKNGRRPSKDKLKEITQKAFAICKSSVG